MSAHARLRHGEMGRAAPSGARPFSAFRGVGCLATVGLANALELVVPLGRGMMFAASGGRRFAGTDGMCGETPGVGRAEAQAILGLPVMLGGLRRTEAARALWPSSSTAASSVAWQPGSPKRCLTTVGPRRGIARCAPVKGLLALFSYPFCAVAWDSDERVS
jgi:hypothetical protein